MGVASNGSDPKRMQRRVGSDRRAGVDVSGRRSQRVRQQRDFGVGEPDPSIIAAERHGATGLDVLQRNRRWGRPFGVCDLSMRSGRQRRVVPGNGRRQRQQHQTNQICGAGPRRHGDAIAQSKTRTTGGASPRRHGFAEEKRVYSRPLARAGGLRATFMSPLRLHRDKNVPARAQSESSSPIGNAAEAGTARPCSRHLPRATQLSVSSDRFGHSCYQATAFAK
jgi:hypothetical protein